MNPGPFEQLIPAQRVSEITLDEDGEGIEAREIHDFGEYSQMKCHYKEVSDKLKEIAIKNQPVKVSFGKINLGRMNPNSLGHMIAYFATPESVWYIDLHQIMAGRGQAVYDSLNKIFDFYTQRVSMNRNANNVFSPLVFFVPLGPFLPS